MLVISMASLPSVHAQSTGITELRYPTSAAAGDLNPISVSATITYRDARPGYLLVVGILNGGTSPKIIPGTAASSPDQCINSSVLAAVCTIQARNSQGAEHVEFKIGGILGDSHGSGNWILNITAALTTSNNTLVRNSGSSISFSISLSPMILTIKVPTSVAASVDGLKQLPGPAQVPISAGLHNLTVPATVEFNNQTRLKFSRWSDGITVPNRTVRISTSRSYEAIYVRQYELTTNGQANSAIGQGWYDAGSDAAISVADMEPMNGILGLLGGKLRFQAWYADNQFLTDSSLGMIVMDRPHTMTVKWQADYTTPLAYIAVIVAILILAYFIVHRLSRVKAPRRRVRKRKRSARASISRILDSNALTRNDLGLK
jgi:hypothetical protein